MGVVYQSLSPQLRLGRVAPPIICTTCLSGFKHKCDVHYLNTYHVRNFASGHPATLQVSTDNTEHSHRI